MKKSNKTGLKAEDLMKLDKDLDYVSENIKAFDIVVDTEKLKVSFSYIED